MKINNIYVGDNIEVLKTFPDNSIDSVVTDPPYGLGKEPNAIEVLQSWITTGYHEVKGKGFMGKEWDAFVPQPIFWKEIYRVLKPGGYVLSFAGTRTYDWMVMAVRLAGFEIRDMIAWVYGSGFPKSMDVSKALDKHLGAEREVVGKDEEWIKRVGKNHNESNTYTDKSFGMVGKNGGNITVPSTDEAKQWQGWGTALKPALEPIVMARKPLDGTVAQNVLKHGVGGINIDGCRVEAKDGDVFGGGGLNSPINGFMGNTENTYKKGSGFRDDSAKGRFPANFIHDGSDEVEALFPDSNGGTGETKVYESYDNDIHFNASKNVNRNSYADEGSASRFFYVAKASKEERNFGLYDFEEKRHTDRNKDDGVGGDNPRNRSNKPKKNFHPTIKPIELMRYLVRMVTPPNGICLDPYLGSGTTAIACEMEKFSWIGIELMPEYAEIAKARIGAVKDYEPTLDTKTIIKESIEEEKEKELGIQNIFDFMEEELK